MTACALALSFAAGAAGAQTQATTPQATSSTATAPPAHPQAKHLSLNERFAAANTTNDGHLTLDQARAGMPMAARHFAAIDKDNKGYVTLADIHTYLKEQRALRHPTPANG
jgi:hypothetical protein